MVPANADNHDHVLNLPPKGSANNWAFFIMATYKPTSSFYGPVKRFSPTDPDLSFYNVELHSHLLKENWAFDGNSLIYLENYKPVVVAKVSRVSVPQLEIYYRQVVSSQPLHLYRLSKTDDFEKLNNSSKKSLNTLISKIHAESESGFICAYRSPRSSPARNLLFPDYLDLKRQGIPIRIGNGYDFGLLDLADPSKWIMPDELPDTQEGLNRLIHPIQQHSGRRPASTIPTGHIQRVLTSLQGLPNE